MFRELNSIPLLGQHTTWEKGKLQQQWIWDPRHVLLALQHAASCASPRAHHHPWSIHQEDAGVTLDAYSPFPAAVV